MVNDRETAAKKAEAATTNKPGTCQLWTRTMFNAPSVGDVDKDGDADAVDGWKSEPAKYKHFNPEPPRGVPIAFSGGSKGYGHRAISLGSGKIRSTDMTATGYKAGVVGTTTIAAIEKAMGVKYLGWSDSISGQLIPVPPPPRQTRGTRVDHALADLREAKKISDDKNQVARARRIQTAIDAVKAIKYL